MKKNVFLIIFVFLFVTIGYLLYLNLSKKEKLPITNEVIISKNETIEIKETKEPVILNDLSYSFNEKIYLKDLTGIETNETLDTTTKLGDNTYNFENYEINYNVVDKVKPLILGGGSSVTVYTGSSEQKVINKFICGDNQTSKPDCHIEGKHDLNKVGTYSVTYVAIDESGNKSTKDFKLVVKKKPKNSSSSSSSTSKPGIPIKNYIDKYKNENTLIGIDVSVWQGNIDFSKAKKSGVEAAIIRLGYGPTSEGKLKLDSKFKANLKGFKEQKIPVGVYFYSYAKTKEDIRKQVDFIVKNLDGTELELPIAFDWENWKTFNNYNVSFKDLNDLYLTFSEELGKHGYKTMLYSSAYYLNKIWDVHNNTWLAYYTSNNDFKKEYMLWQASSRGKVSGISGHVDVNIIYMNKIK